MTPNQLIHVEAPHVVYTNDQITADYTYTTTNVKNINNRIVVRTTKTKLFFFCKFFQKKSNLSNFEQKMKCIDRCYRCKSKKN